MGAGFLHVSDTEVWHKGGINEQNIRSDCTQAEKASKQGCVTPVLCVSLKLFLRLYVEVLC